MATGDKKRAVMTDDINNSGSAYPVLGPTGDGSNVTAAFTAAGSRTNISTGEKLSVICGKIAKWFTDLGAAAFRAVDATPTAGSTNLVESGGVKSAISKVETDLASIHATGTTNTTGAVITAGTYFYLNGALVQAKTDIANGATFTNGTNYEAVTAGALNAIPKYVGATVTDMLSLTSGTITEYTIPEDGYYFVVAVNTNTAGFCAAFIGLNNMTTYLQANSSGNATYIRATTGVIPFKKGTVIEVRAQFASNGAYGKVCKLT